MMAPICCSISRQADMCFRAKSWTARLNLPAPAQSHLYYIRKLREKLYPPCTCGRETQQMGWPESLAACLMEIGWLVVECTRYLSAQGDDSIVQMGLPHTSICTSVKAFVMHVSEQRSVQNTTKRRLKRRSQHKSSR